MFSANPSISPTGLKPLDVAKGRGNGVRLRRMESQKREGMETDGGGTGSDWGGTGSD